MWYNRYMSLNNKQLEILRDILANNYEALGMNLVDYMVTVAKISKSDAEKLAELRRKMIEAKQNQ